MDWKQQFDIIKDKISHNLREKNISYSFQNAAEYLEVGIGKVRAWEKGQRPSADDLEMIARKLGFSPHWLLMGEGDPYSKRDLRERFFEKVVRVVRMADMKGLAELRAYLGVSEYEWEQASMTGELPRAWVGKLEQTGKLNSLDIAIACLTEEQIEEAQGFATRTTEEPPANHLAIKRFAPNADLVPIKDGIEHDAESCCRVNIHSTAGAGDAIEAWEPEPIDSFCIPARYHRDSYVFVRVKGMSMFPEIRPGSVVAVDTADKEIVAGEIYAVYMPYEGLVLKKVYVDPNRTLLILRSVNPDFQDIELPADRDGLIYGKVALAIVQY